MRGESGRDGTGKDDPVAIMRHGVAQHMAYQAGQIAPIGKLAEQDVQ